MEVPDAVLNAHAFVLETWLRFCGSSRQLQCYRCLISCVVSGAVDKSTHLSRQSHPNRSQHRRTSKRYRIIGVCTTVTYLSYSRSSLIRNGFVVDFWFTVFSDTRRLFNVYYVYSFELLLLFLGYINLFF